MSRVLLILRHAKSSWDSAADSDFDRPLAERGERDAPRMGAWMKAQGWIPDYVISSPARRAAQTVQAVCAALDLDTKQIHWDERIYGAYDRELMQLLAEIPADAKCVLLAGHNPGLEDLLSHLWGKNAQVPANGKLMPTAALAQVELPDDWQQLSEGVAWKVTVIRPKEID